MTIRSESQRVMFEKAAADKEYAASKLAAHEAVGNPRLPMKVDTDPRPKANAQRPKLKIFGMT